MRALAAGIVAVWLSLLTPACLCAQTPLPPSPARHVSDPAHILSAGAASQIDSRLVDFEQKTGNQVVAYVARSLPAGEALEDYVHRLFQSWKIGERTRNNGILLAIFVNDHRLRIEVGNGLEGALPDVVAGRIIRDTIAPRFRANDYDGGVAAGIDAILKATQGEYTAPAGGRTGGRISRPQAPVQWLIAAGLVGALAGAIGRGFLMQESSTPVQIGNAVLGGVIGGIGHPIALALGFGINFFAGIIILAIIWRIITAMNRGYSYTNSGWGNSWNGWSGSSGGWGGGWGGGGGSDGGGGFSGGGGSSGGGGASGSW